MEAEQARGSAAQLTVLVASVTKDVSPIRVGVTEHRERERE